MYENGSKRRNATRSIVVFPGSGSSVAMLFKAEHRREDYVGVWAAIYFHITLSGSPTYLYLYIHIACFERFFSEHMEFCQFIEKGATESCLIKVLKLSARSSCERESKWERWYPGYTCSLFLEGFEIVDVLRNFKFRERYGLDDERQDSRDIVGIDFLSTILKEIFHSRDV